MKAKVEKFKQKPSVLEMSKQVKKISRVRKALNLKFEEYSKKAIQARELLGQIDKGVEEYLKNFPKTPTIELDNQEEEVRE